jgi:hypothetical protein
MHFSRRAVSKVDCSGFHQLTVPPLRKDIQDSFPFSSVI